MAAAAPAIPWIAAAIGALGIAQGYGSSKEAAAAEKYRSLYQAEVARRNAVIGEQASKMATDAGEQQGQLRRMSGTQDLENAKTSYAAGNLDVGVGSPNNVIRDISSATERDVMTIRHEAARTAWNFKNQGFGYTASAGLDTMAAENFQRAGQRNANSSLIGGAGSLADKWIRYNSMYGDTNKPTGPKVEEGGE